MTAIPKRFDLSVSSAHNGRHNNALNVGNHNVHNSYKGRNARSVRSVPTEHNSSARNDKPLRPALNGRRLPGTVQRSDRTSIATNQHHDSVLKSPSATVDIGNSTKGWRVPA